MIAYKLFRLRKDGTLGPLFINAKQRIDAECPEWLEGKAHRTKGFAFRPGWHCCSTPNAPHLHTKGRVWCEVQITNYKRHHRPQSQGGLWFTAKWMRVLRVMR